MTRALTVGSLLAAGGSADGALTPMNANDLIALLTTLPPEQREWPIVGNDKFDGYGDLVEVQVAELTNDDDTRQCLYLDVQESKSGEWLSRRRPRS
jgi:hypothetical protein